ncbi:MAG: hypothetical protein PHT75_04530 [Bacilli bacterium]|nr:hypothetical protein [Bacilli bacterium]MDD3305358.1 hypothetical protein [Bacilli bacterium]MDD4054055.1 hypothetical protein [Bacilli bacterium]MDD4411813.1 hypothetical protein [Bacilli bacterium]
MNYYLESDITKLKLNNEIINILKSYNILLVKDLWQLKRENLKEYTLNDSQINEIIIKMQLLGLDLNKKVYNKN